MQRERITAVIPFRDFRDDKYLMAVTKDGTIKKTAISQFDTNRKTGLIAINLKDGDELVAIKQTSGSDNVIIITKNGKCICFSEDDVRPMGRIAGGVRAIKLEDDDEVVSMGTRTASRRASRGDEQRIRQEDACKGLQDPGKRRQGAADIRQEQVQEDRKTDRRHGR